MSKLVVILTKLMVDTPSEKNIIIVEHLIVVLLKYRAVPKIFKIFKIKFIF